jgi:2-polyprenyl-3-methyl-5-hydroxy-6-metoxy-1,4-benzoquinol methylase
MSEQVSSCPLCGSSINKPFDQRQFRGQPVTNVICRRCGLVYQSPRMTAAERQAFYESQYRLLYQGQEGPSLKDLATQAARAQAALEFSTDYIVACTRLLDIGCSTGALLQKFASHYHCRAHGVEPGTRYRQYAQSQGLPVYASLDEIGQGEGLHFDLVSMMHVLEHLPHPVEYLREIREKYLVSSGWLLLEVPNLYAHDCFEVAHLVSFSAHTLAEVVHKAGFKVVRLRAQGAPRSHLIPLYLTMLARPDGIAPFKLKPERLVRLRRQVGFFYRRAVTRLYPKRAWTEPTLAGRP